VDSLALRIILVGVTFVWLGAVLAISFLEAPLKFRAPGITIPLGLSIGRLVFRALNIAELVFAALITGALIIRPYPPTVGVAALTAAAWVTLAIQIAGLRPPLDRRAKQLLTGRILPHSPLHLAYIALEIVKVGVLIALGSLLLTGSAA